MNRTKTVNLILCGLFSALICAGAFIRIPAFGVPVTLQTTFVLLSGFLLGGKYSAVSCGVYMAIGLMGLPVFAEGGGSAYVLHPSFGFIVGFIFGGGVTGCIAGKTARPSCLRLSAAALCGLAVIYAVGTVYFFIVTRLNTGTAVPLSTLLYTCVAVTLPKDIILAAAAVAVALRIIPAVRVKSADYK